MRGRPSPPAGEAFLAAIAGDQEAQYVLDGASELLLQLAEAEPHAELAQIVVQEEPVAA